MVTLDVACEGFEPVRSARDQHDVATVTGDPSCERRADPARRARYEGDLLGHASTSW
jgi:hypothetical protein